MKNVFSRSEEVLFMRIRMITKNTFYVIRNNSINSSHGCNAIYAGKVIHKHNINLSNLVQCYVNLGTRIRNFFFWKF